MYRLIVESLLGVRREADRLRFVPCLPPDWNGFTLRYRYGDTCYRITVRRSDARRREGLELLVDGVAQPTDSIQLCDDHQEHRVDVYVRTT